MVYLVSYDLNRQKDYTKLISRIKQYSAWARVLYSQWLVQSVETEQTVLRDLSQYIDADDAVLVTEITKNNVAWRNLMINDDTMNQWSAAARAC